MADLGSFDRPILKDKYVDVLDTIRENIKRSKAAADAAQQTANDALAAAGGVDAALGNYMPKSGGRFTGPIATQGIVSEATIVLVGPGDGLGTLMSAGPWGEERGAALQLNGVTASDTGFGTSGQWALYSPGNPTLNGSDRLLWGGNDLGRWAPIDPASKVDVTTLELFMPKSGGDFTGPVGFYGAVTQIRHDLVFTNYQDKVAWYFHNPGNAVNGHLYISPPNADGSSGEFGKGLRLEEGAGALFWNGNDLGRWAAINPDNKADAPRETQGGDLNTWRPAGFYEYDPIPGNAPIQSPNIRVINIGKANRHTQLAFPYEADRAFFRRGSDGGYGGWLEFWHTGNFDAGSTVRLGAGTSIGWIASAPNQEPMNAMARSISFAASGTGDRWGSIGGFHTQADHQMNNGQFTSAFSMWVHQPNTRYAQMHWGWFDHSAAFTLHEGGNHRASFHFEYNGTFSAPILKTQSDIRKKRDLRYIDDALSSVHALNGYNGIWIDTDQPGTFLIAQEVEQVLPHAVSEVNDVKILDYNAVVALLVNAVKELNAKVEGALQHG